MLRGCCLEESLLTVLSELPSSALFWRSSATEGPSFPHTFAAFLTAQCNEPETAQTHYYHLAWNDQCFLTDSQIFLCTWIYSATWKTCSQNEFDLMKGNMAWSDIRGCSTPSMVFPCLSKVWLKRRKISTRPEYRLTNKIKLKWILIREIVYWSHLVGAKDSQ